MIQAKIHYWVSVIHWEISIIYFVQLKQNQSPFSIVNPVLNAVSPLFGIFLIVMNLYLSKALRFSFHIVV